ncbi:mandelate racemase/muconate lactonizing enzyme family protein [Sulfitobacter mediterraneus]|uniref:mandelate racemase/muconate lactonizing enzyme family protein n=1 Tax=Sulfitobacter mediterraneus TaxID=83219 RepID=UPI0021A374C9|nr:mandelate racemase/muconate lactonizing enzyme family protein [Sulfitobacter mediterraneus]UWR13443.1 mandelate racemase/muconate lactonizing enzyme family protein [Sulfitobacter mediterraneus]
MSPKTTWVFVVITAADGATGWGEATHFGAEQELGGLITGLAKSLADAPADGANDLLARLAQFNMNFPRRALCSALEQACLDLQAHQLSGRMLDLFGGAKRATVPFYANINRGISDRSPDGFARQAKNILEKTGARAVKIAPFDGLRWQLTDPSTQAQLIYAGLARVAAVRDALPPDVLLMVDCHARFNPFMAGQVMRELSSLNIYWIEEPCDMARLEASDQRALRHAANANGMRLAGAETVTTLDEMVRLISAGGHDVVLPDLRLTGVADGMAMLRLAADMNVGASIHNPVGPVLDAISTQIAAALPSFLILERQVGETEIFDLLRGSQVRVSDGKVVLPDLPGFGFRPDTTYAEPLQTAHQPTAVSFVGMAGAGPDS